MLTAGSRFWFAVTTLTLLGAAVYYLSSGGEKYGTLVLVSAAITAAVPGSALVALRDGDVALAEADGSGRQHRPAASRFPAAWPAMVAFGAGVTVVGMATGGALFYVGLGILGVTLVEWMVQAWAERSTGDPTVNLALRNRIMYPVEIPALAVIGIAIMVLAFSRVLLALPKTGSTVIAIVVASIILAVGALLSARPRVSSSLLAVVVVLGAVALLGGGIVSAVIGEREFEHHEADHAPAEPGAAEHEGAEPGEGAEAGAGQEMPHDPAVEGSQPGVGAGDG